MDIEFDLPEASQYPTGMLFECEQGIFQNTSDGWLKGQDKVIPMVRPPPPSLPSLPSLPSPSLQNVTFIFDNAFCFKEEHKTKTTKPCRKGRGPTEYNLFMKQMMDLYANTIWKDKTSREKFKCAAEMYTAHKEKSMIT